MRLTLDERVDQRTAAPVVTGPDEDERGVVTPDGSSLLYWRFPQPARDVPREGLCARLMRQELEGGAAPVEVLSYRFPRESPVGCDHDCGTVRDAACVLAAYFNDRTEFYALDPVRGKGARLATLGSPSFPVIVSTWSLSHDGSRIAAIDETAIQIVDLPTGRVEDLRVRDLAAGLAFAVSWTADDQRLWLCLGDLIELDLAGRSRVVWKEDGRTVWKALSSRDGRRLALGVQTLDRNARLLENF